jgi:hypothetical protein
MSENRCQVHRALHGPRREVQGMSRHHMKGSGATDNCAVTICIQWNDYSRQKKKRETKAQKTYGTESRSHSW